jgi:hypothetical protein
LILDAGVLVSIDRDEEHALVLLTAAKRTDEPLHTSEAVVAQVWRDGARQARLASVLKDIEVHPLDDDRAVGALLARSGGSDVVDAHVVFLGAALSQRVVTSDSDDLTSIATAMGRSQPDILAWG